MTDDADLTGDARYEQGLRVRRAVLGDDHVDRAGADATELTRPFQEYITRAAWGEVWTRPALDRRTRSCLTLALLATLGHHDELALHVHAAVRNGVAPAQIVEVLMHTAVYAGVPAANSAIGVVQRTLATMDVAQQDGGTDDA